MGFWTKLEESIARRNSLLCVGLDPHPGPLPGGHDSVGAFMRSIIEQTADVAAVFKPNIAFFEALGRPGMDALRETLAAIPHDTPVILDAKRNDISSTAAAYARAVFDELGADAVTLNPYLGSDGVAPFLSYSDRGVFVLCKTSNPGAGELQDWSQYGVPLYRRVAELAGEWAQGREIGLVIGATYPEDMAEIRAAWPKTWFLVPGVGAQGGDLDAALQAGLRPDGLGLVINSSRGILYADDPRQAALETRDAINRARAAALASPPGAERARRARLSRLALALFESGCVQLGDFVLHSGAHSPIYVDLRRLVISPQVLELAAAEYARLLKGLDYQRIAAIPYAGLPIGTAVALQTRDPLIYPRREVKEYGTRRQIEGEYQAGERVVLLDDLISSGGSKLEAARPLQEAGLVVQDVVVLIDREQGGAEDLARHGLRLHAATTLREIVALLVEAHKLDRETQVRVERYLAGEA
jgi:uridine monophosphate synthetase